MAKKNRLQSGSYRIQRRYRGDDGKTHLKSFTARSRAEAEAMAAEWEAHRSQVTGRVTIAGAIDKYIAMKASVLSPSTIRSYAGIRRKYFSGPFGQLELLEVTNLDIQLWVSAITAMSSPKTVRNVFGLLSAVLSMFMPDFTVHATLPAKVKPDLYCPSTSDINAVMAATTDLQIRAAILLASVGTMRQGEICALRWDDITDRTIRIRASMVKGVDGGWQIKPPKTLDSNRDVLMPADVMDFLRTLPRQQDGRVIEYNPQQLGHRFQTAVKHAGVHWFRFHDLRHYSASQMHLSGIPDKYIEARGGWRDGSSVMKRTYQTVIDLEKARQDRLIVGVFSDLVI